MEANTSESVLHDPSTAVDALNAQSGIFGRLSEHDHVSVQPCTVTEHCIMTTHQLECPYRVVCCLL